jgi:hypothetical protein
VFATTTPGDENIPDPICAPATKATPLMNPIVFSPLVLRTSSDSLKLALKGNRSLSNPKFDPERERALW